ncbi:MAG: hypothetical protein HQL63_07705 [Magnetococcales bacterium]|nr:hypothetical protein [Magnetococcales bacterium]MBF0321481.1 hypothetical protein [Magnetococcales bacterium]
MNQDGPAKDVQSASIMIRAGNVREPDQSHGMHRIFVEIGPCDPSCRYKGAPSEYLSGMNYKETNQFVDSMSRMFVNSQTLSRFSIYDRASMWQFVPSYIWPEVFLAIELIKIVKPVIKKMQPGLIFVEPPADDGAPIWVGAMQGIADSLEIPMRVIGQNFQLQNRFYNRPDLVEWGRFFFKVGIKLLMRVIISLVSPKAPICSSLGVKKKLLYVTYPPQWAPSSHVFGGFHEKNLGCFLPALKKEGWGCILALDSPHDWVRGFRKIIRVMNQRRKNVLPGVEWKSYFSCYGISSILEEFRAKIFFAKKWDNLKNDLVFIKNFHYDGISMWPALDHVIEKAFLRIMPECSGMRRTAQEIIERIEPSAIMAIYETGPFQRSVLLQGKLAGIPGVGLMHGMILDNHYDYVYQNLSSDPQQYPDTRLIPDVTCVWGSLWKDNLTRLGFYPDSTVRITGNWKYDDMGSFLKSVDLNIFKKHFNIPPDRRVVLILTAMYDTLAYINECLKALLQRSDVTPLIKLHPSEESLELSDLLSKANLPSTTLVNGSLPELLAISDLVITQLSTTITETVIVGRPLLIVDFMQQAGWEQYTSIPELPVVTEVDQLGPAINRSLDDPEFQAPLVRARERLISQWFYKLDGLAATRVVEVLEELYAGSRAGRGDPAGRP